MMRTQISLNSELHTKVRARATALGISIAEYIRRLVNQDLANTPSRSCDCSIIFDLGASKGTNIASEKDQMIGVATSAGKRRRANAP